MVELVPGEKTSEEAIKITYEFMQKIGKIPVVLKKEVPGFLANRLAAALWREALDLLNKDVVSVEDIDKAVYAGMGLRWAVMGPFLTYHLGGGEEGLEYFVDHLRSAFSEWWNSMETWTSIPNSVVKKAADNVKRMKVVRENTYDELVTWRDEKLMELLDLLHSST